MFLDGTRYELLFSCPQNDVMAAAGSSKVSTWTYMTMHAMDEFLDGEIGENSKLLPDLLRGLKKEETLLQGQVNSLPAHTACQMNYDTYT